MMASPRRVSPQAVTDTQDRHARHLGSTDIT